MKIIKYENEEGKFFLIDGGQNSLSESDAVSALSMTGG
jgi:hypothetical protein